MLQVPRANGLWPGPSHSSLPALRCAALMTVCIFMCGLVSFGSCSGHGWGLKQEDFHVGCIKRSQQVDRDIIESFGGLLSAEYFFVREAHCGWDAEVQAGCETHFRR